MPRARDRCVDGAGNPADLLRLDEAGHEDSVGARLDEGAEAFDRRLQQLVAAQAEPEDVGAGVDEEVDPRVLGRRAGGLDPRALLVEVDERGLLARGGVLEVDTDGAGLDRRRDRLADLGRRSPKPASMSALTGTPTAAAIRPTASIISSRDSPPSGRPAA